MRSLRDRSGDLEDPATLPLAKRRLILYVTLSGIAASTFPVTVLSAALPDIADDLGTTDSIVSWVLAAPLLAVAVATPIAGKLGDVYGHRRVYIAGFIFSTVFSVLVSQAWNVESLIAFRTLGQAAGAATGPAAMAILMRVFTGDERAPAIGMWSAVTAASPTIGIIAGGPLIDATSWRAVFIVQAVLATVAIIAAYLILPNFDQRRKVQFDIPGAVTLGAGVGALMLGINRAPAWGLSHPAVSGGLLGGVALLVLFVAIERRATAPLLPLGLMRRPGFSMPVVSQLFIGSSYMGTFIVTPMLLERIFGFGTTARAMLMVARPVSFSAASWLGGRQERAIGARKLALVGSSIIAGGAVVTGLAGTIDMVVVVVIGLAMSGFGNGYGRAPLVTSVGNTVDPEDLGIGAATLTMTSQIGSSFGITVLSTIIGESDDPGRFMLVYAIGAGLALASLPILARIPASAGPQNGPDLGHHSPGE